MKYAFIERERIHYPVTIQCNVLEVHRSGYYAWSRAKRLQLEGKRAQETRTLREAIASVHRESGERYGAPRITAVLRQRGLRCSRGRVARTMRANRIKAKQRRAYRVTTRSNHWLASPNLLERRFGMAERINQIWTLDHNLCCVLFHGS